MRSQKIKIFIAGLVLGIFSSVTLLSVHPAQAQVSGSEPTCSELDAIIGALNSTGQQEEEFRIIAQPLVAVAITAKTTYTARMAAKKAAMAASITTSLGTIPPEFAPIDPTDIPTRVTAEPALDLQNEARMKFLMSEVLKNTLATQVAAGAAECTEAINKVMDAMDKAAQAAIDTYNRLNTLETIISFLEAMGGSLLGFGGTPDIGKSVTTVTDIVMSKKQLIGVNLALRLYGIEMKIIEEAGTSSIISGTALSARKAKLAAKISELEARQQKLKELAKIGFTDFLKAFAMSIGRQVILSATNTLISKMIKQFGAESEYEQMRALARNVFGIEYIRENYSGDTEKALITKYLMDNAYTYEPGKIKAAHAAIEQQAIRYAGEFCSRPNIKDPNYNSKAARCGNVNANPLFLKSEAMQGAMHGIAISESSAQRELLQNQGINSIREYNRGSYEEQQQFDAQNAQLLAAVELAQKKLKEAKKLNSAEGIASAQAELALADKNYQENYKGVKNGAVKLLFQGVTTPGALLGKFITDKGLSTMLNTDKLDENRLPASIQGVTKMVSNMLTQWIGGGNPNLGITLKNVVFSSISPGISAISTAIENNSNNNSSSGSSGSGSSGGGNTAGAINFQIRGPAPAIR